MLIIYIYTYIVIRKDFDLLRWRATLLYGANNLQLSTRQDKKNHFGHPNYEHYYLIYEDEDKKFGYRQTVSKIRDKNGNLTYKDRNSPNFCSYRLLYMWYYNHMIWDK